MFNLSKSAQSYNALLSEQTEKDKSSIDGMSVTEKLLENSHNEPETVSTTEAQFEKREKMADTITEKQMDSTKKSFNLMRSDRNDNAQVPPLAALNRAQEADRLKQYKAAEQPEQDTEFWDKYVGDELLGEDTKMVNKFGPSQLADNPDRFSGTPESILNGKKNIKVEKLVMASLKDADARLFHIYAQASGRELTKNESSEIEEITQQKIAQLMSGGLTQDNTFGDRDCPDCELGIEDHTKKLHRQISDPNAEHDEVWEQARQELEELTRQQSEQPLDQGTYESRQPKNIL